MLHCWRVLQVFGVLYTVSKEKRVSPLFVAVRLLLDVLQLWLLIVQPQNGYMIRSDWIVWRIVSFIGESSGVRLQDLRRCAARCVPCVRITVLPVGQLRASALIDMHPQASTSSSASGATPSSWAAST